jgi:S-adenosylmethionine:tRNA ribosyltransferase-isomerase
MLLGSDGAAEDRVFSELPSLLAPGDLLVRNNAKVIAARLMGKKRSGGAAEALLIRRGEIGGREAWLCLVRPGNRFKIGQEFVFGEGALAAKVAGREERGLAWLEFDLAGDAFLDGLERFGRIPLPPYIERPENRPDSVDAARYQTYYASRPGAVAAPTAGLHFTPELDARLSERGIGIAELTLQVGPGTFRPIKTASLDSHRMDAERYEIPEAAWRGALAARERGGRVVAVGTTSARALEAAAAGGGVLSGWADIFIRPGHRFRMLDGLITNFHLPGSTPLALLSALSGRERALAAYALAAERGYRFYSYGDAMLAWRAPRQKRNGDNGEQAR